MDPSNPIVTTANVHQLLDQAEAERAARKERDAATASAAADPREAQRRQLQAKADGGKASTSELIQLGFLSSTTGGKRQTVATAAVKDEALARTIGATPTGLIAQGLASSKPQRGTAA